MFNRKTDNLLTLVKIALLSLWIFSAPTNLFYKILPNFGFVGGLQIDYLIPKLYFSDLVGLVMVGVWGLPVLVTVVVSLLDKKKKSRHPTPKFPNNLSTFAFIILFASFVTSIFFTPYPIASFWFLFSLCIHLGSFFVATRWWKETGTHTIRQFLIGVLALTMLFQSGLGLFQFTYQRELLGFGFWGEPTLRRDIGLSKGSFAWADQLVGTQLGLRILPYGTTPHPNVLAGFLVLGILVIISSWEKNQWNSAEKGFLALCVGGAIFTALLTNSMSAWLTFGIGICFLALREKCGEYALNRYLKKYGLVLIFLASILVPILINAANTFTSNESTSLSRRNFLNRSALNSVMKHPIVGVGLNQFTVQIALGSPNPTETTAFLQPAHHLFLLFIAENGVLGVLLLTAFYKLFAEKYIQQNVGLLIILLPIFTLDHYFYSLVSGQLILLIGLCFWNWDVKQK